MSDAPNHAADVPETRTSTVTSTVTASVTDTTTDAATDAEAIAAGIDDMYDAFLQADRERFDGHLHAEVTTWESHLPGPLRTRAELDAYREERDRSGARPALARLCAQDKRIDAWGDTGVARYVLVAEPSDGPAEYSRVTDVLRRTGGEWLIVHHHSELLGS
ncbi:DUF4440 domain-containing protein [Streptosporangium sp. NPDC051023]|uniref:nuclear transport factor 2 family protein n=1 Tax=Streptosporangium sp. NPDC051023 TaxID=3155410 RepID=UPI00344BFFB5